MHLARSPAAAILVLGALLVAGCGTAAPSEPPLGSRETPSAAAVSTTTDRTGTMLSQRVAAGPLDVGIPAGWHTRRGLSNPGGNFALAYMSPGAIPSDCRATGTGGGVCTAWPMFTLSPDGIVVAVRLYSMPGTEPPAGGTPTAVDGLQARRISGPPSDACSAVGGSQSIVVVMPAIPDTSGWLSIDACVAGPDTKAADHEFAAIVASATIAGEPTPSEGR